MLPSALPWPQIYVQISLVANIYCYLERLSRIIVQIEIDVIEKKLDTTG